MKGSAKKAVGGTRPCTSRATHRKPGGRHRRDREHDQLHRRLEPEQLAERNDQQVDAKVADRRPMIIVIVLQPGRMIEVELDPIAAHVAEQVDQRRDRRVEQRDHRREHDEREDTSAIPTRDAPSPSPRSPGWPQPPLSYACNDLPARVLAARGQLSMTAAAHYKLLTILPVRSRPRWTQLSSLSASACGAPPGLASDAASARPSRLTLLALALRAHRPWQLGRCGSTKPSAPGSRPQLALSVDTCVPTYEAHPPFYYSLLKLWRGCSARSHAAMRGLSVLFGIAHRPRRSSRSRLEQERHAPTGRPLLARRARRFLAACSPMLVVLGQEARPYPLLIFAYAIAILALLRLMREFNAGGAGRWTSWLMLGCRGELDFVVARARLALRHRASRWHCFRRG